MPKPELSGAGYRASEADAIWQPKMIRGFVTRQGKLLHPSVQRAWGYIAQGIRSFPAEVEFRMDELGSYFFASSRVQPRDWIKTLIFEGLAEVIDRKRGRKGGVRLRLFDPMLIAPYRLAKGDMQRPLPSIDRDSDVRAELKETCVAPGRPRSRFRRPLRRTASQMVPPCVSALRAIEPVKSDLSQRNGRTVFRQRRGRPWGCNLRE